MATRIYQLTDQPVDVVNAAPINLPMAPALTVGEEYSGRYSGNGRTIMYVMEATSVPDPDDPALPVQNLEDIGIIPKTGEGVYIWTRDGTGILVVNETQ